MQHNAERAQLKEEEAFCNVTHTPSDDQDTLREWRGTPLRMVQIKKFVRATLNMPIAAVSWYLRVVATLLPFAVQRMRETLNSERDSNTTDVLHTPANSGPIAITFATPNTVCEFRATSFSSKEPETLEWIEEFGGRGAFYDIGSNIGGFAIYHAKLFSDPVYAFEPSVLNLKWLTRNISLNNVMDRVVVIPVPLTAANEIAPFQLSSLEEGGALSSFAVKTGYDGQQLETQMQYKMLGFSLDFLVGCGAISSPPSIIKLDVDGIEHLILSGASSVLSHPSLCSVLVEVNEGFDQQRYEVPRILSAAGLRCREKRQSELFEAGEFSNTYNQIWVRD